jgi:hypothetical protein
MRESPFSTTGGTSFPIIWPGVKNGKRSTAHGQLLYTLKDNGYGTVTIYAITAQYSTISEGEPHSTKLVKKRDTSRFRAPR